MKYDFTAFVDHESSVLAWLEGEYASIQSGRATPSIVDSVHININGSRTALNHCASCSLEDAKTIKVTPYDKTIVLDVESAIREQLPSMNISSGDTGIRIIVPEMTSERRTLLERVIKEKTEEARQSIRNARERELVNIKKEQDAKTMSKDEIFLNKKNLQNKVDVINQELEKRYKNKIQSIQG